MLTFFLQSCSSGIPAGIQPVTNFDIHRYLGCWYEIARLDHRFERGLQQVMATYSLNGDGTIRVENAGVDSKTGRLKKAVGKAKIVSDKSLGHLKVSFFGPFYGSYVIFALAEDYSVALVCGASRDYCWILARDSHLEQKKLDTYTAIAKKNGFKVDKFIYPAHADTTAALVD